MNKITKGPITGISMKNYIVFSLWTWFKSGVYWFLIMGLLGISAWIQTKSSPYIKLSGLSLQVIGTLGLIFSLSQRLQIFKGHGLLKDFYIFIKSFPTNIRPQHHWMTGETGGFSSAIGHLTAKKRAPATLEDEVNELKERITAMDEKLEARSKEFNKSIQHLNAIVDKLSSNISMDIEKTHATIFTSMVGDISREFFFILCILIGVIFATVPTEIENLVNLITG